MKAEQRVAERKELEPLYISDLTSLDPFSLLARSGVIVDASASGFRIHIHRKDLVPKVLRENLTLDCIVGERVKMHIQQMELEIDGHVARTALLGKGTFEVAVDFSEQAPQYWRECLIDLLPMPGEMDSLDS